MTIYNPSGGIIIDAPITKEAVEKFVLMGDWYVLLPFMSLSALDIPEGSYINYKGKKWEIMSPVYPNSSGSGYSYSLQFDDQQNKLKKSICFWLGGPTPEAVFSDTTDLTSFGNLIVANMNRELGTTIWEFGGLVNVDNPDIVKVVSFSGDTCWNAVNNIANTFDCEWWTEQNGGRVYLFFGKLERGSDEIFKEGDVVSQMPARKSNNDDGYGTRFYVFGSTRNLTSDYGQADQGGAPNHVSEIRLRLPNSQQYIDARSGLTPSEVTPVVVFFDDVYPKNTDTVTSVEEKTITPEEGEPYPAYIVYAGNTPFVPSDDIEDDLFQIQFTSGDLTDLTFEVSINYDPATWTPEDGFDKKFEIVTQIETSGDSVSIIPNANMKPKPGDTFVLTGVKLSQQRIEEAEQELLEVGTEYAEKHSGDTNVYDCPTNPVYCATNDKNYDAGQVVILQDARFGADGRRSRIQGYEKKLYNEYVATYTVGDNRVYTRTGKIENDVKQNIYSQRIGTTTSGAAVYLITRYDQTPATDYNAYSALRTLWQFANKQTDETFKGNVSFEKDIRSSDFKKGDIVGAGYSAYKDENGDAVIEADKIVIRKEARFNQTVINQVTFQRGSTVMTLAGCEITAVEEIESAYRCYYNNKQGSRFSGFVVQDQARCQRYDATQSVIAKYYWRLVVGVGNDYVDLSKSDVDGSGIPAIGDEIVQFGNRTDATRQRAIVIDPLNGSVEVYAHIDSYSLLNRGFVGMGIDQQSKEAYIYSYGDLLAGDRDPLAEDAEYIRFTKDEGEARRTLKIQARMSIKAGSSGLANLAEWAPVQEQLDAMEYITEALKGSTTISGGLILTSLISLLDQDGATKSGINGIYDSKKLGGGIAAWYGGDMLDKFDYYYWDETDWTLKPKPDVEIPDNIAQGLDRMDGTGYRAGGNFWWDEDGNIYADPLSFFVGEETVGNVLALFRFNYKPDTINKPFEDVLSVTPMRPFTELTISGAQNRLYFGDSAHYIELDENGYFHFSHGVYSDGFLSALGLNPNTGGGGGGGATALSELSDVQLSGLLTGDVLIYDGTHWVNRPQSGIVPDLSEYATRTWVQQQGYATSAALAAHAGDTSLHVTSSERTLWNRTAADFAAIVGADSDQIINKWEEVVAFLDTYTEADTLANLLSNKVDKTTRVVAGTGLTGGGALAGNVTLSLASRTLWGNAYDGSTDLGGDIVLDKSTDDRQLSILKSGTLKFKASTAGWAWGLTTYALDGVTPIGGIGTYGTEGNIQYWYIGLSYDQPKLMVTPAGLVGINKTPAYSLDVAGEARIRNRLYFNDTEHYIEIDANGYFHFSKGVYSDEYLSVKGQNPDAGGGTGGASYLAELSDVSLSTLASGQLLMYNGSKWINVAQSTIVPTLKNLTFGSKTYNGSTAQTITATDLGALTAHQTLYSLAFQAGAFSAKTYSPNTGTQTVNIPTKVSHLSNDSGFITAAALTGYATQSWVQGLGYITAATANATFATKLGVSGNQIGTYVNGKLSNLITVPYATNTRQLNGYDEENFFRDARGVIESSALDTFAIRRSGVYNVSYSSYTESLLSFKGTGSSSALEIRANYNGLLYARFSADGTRYSTGWKQFAFTDSNVASATKLQTARKLWGNSFNGEQDVDGEILFAKGSGDRQLQLSSTKGVRYIVPSGGWAQGMSWYKSDGSANLGMIGAYGSSDTILYWFIGPSYSAPKLTILPSGYVGVGKVTPNYPLDVAGVVHATTGLFTEGYLSAKGQNTASDARLKTYMEDIELSVQDIANAPAWRYKWKSDKSVDVGSTAQYWGAIVPELTHKLPDGKHYGLDYGKTGTLGSIIVAREVIDLRKQVAENKKQIAELKQTLKKYMS